MTLPTLPDSGDDGGCRPTVGECPTYLKNQSTATMKQVIDKVLTEVEGGSTMADALSGSGGGFSTVYIAMVRAGESAGVLDQVLKSWPILWINRESLRPKQRGRWLSVDLL